MMTAHGVRIEAHNIHCGDRLNDRDLGHLASLVVLGPDFTADVTVKRCEQRFLMYPKGLVELPRSFKYRVPSSDNMRSCCSVLFDLAERWVSDSRVRRLRRVDQSVALKARSSRPWTTVWNKVATPKDLFVSSNDKVIGFGE
jgi:hypothetical protein